MDVVTNWGGQCFGWVGDDGLFDTNGRHVGQFYRGIIYAEAGHYLGELRDGRLITDSNKKDTHSWYGFVPNPEPTLGPKDGLKDQPPREMPEGFEDFPSSKTIAG